MLIIRQRAALMMLLALCTPLAVFAVALFAQATLASTHTGGVGSSIANFFPGIDSPTLQRYITTLAASMRKLVWGSTVLGSSIAVLLVIARTRGDRETISIDKRIAAIFVPIFWFVLFSLFFPGPYGDESVHQRAIQGIHDGDWNDTRPLSMVPGYHVAVAVFTWPFGPGLIASRLVTLLTTIGMLVCYYLAIRQWRRSDAAQVMFALALLPLLYPFAVGVYTDAPSIFLICAALWALARKRMNVSAGLMFIACFVRQSNLVWALFLVALGSIQLWKAWQEAGHARTLWKEFLRAVWLPAMLGYGVLMVAFVAIMIFLTRGLIWGDVPLNRARPNIAQLYTLAFFVLLIWAPVWIGRLRDDAPALKDFTIRAPVRASMVYAGLVVLAVVLVYTFENPHPWNQYWYYLRNNPLIWMDESPWLRVVGVLAVYWTAWTVARLWRDQPFRTELALVAVFSVLSLVPLALVEPRYFMLPFALANAFLVLPPTDERRLLTWWGILSVAIFTVIVIGHLRYIFLAW